MKQWEKDIKKAAKKARDLALDVFNVFPIGNRIVFESNPDFSDDSFCICDAFFREGVSDRYQIYWLRKDRREDIVPDGWNVKSIYSEAKNPVEWFRKQYVLHTARCIFDAVDFIPKKRANQFRLVLSHGMPIKKIDRWMERIGNFDYISIGSEFFRDYYRSLGISDEKIICMGLARNDFLPGRKGFLREMMGVLPGQKFVIWMPTYRQHKSSSEACNVPKGQNDETGMPIIRHRQDWILLNDRLRNLNMILVIKPHQSQDMSVISLEELSNIRILTNDAILKNHRQLYSLMADTDALITDYSSVYMDYLLVDRPIALTIDDFEVYSREVGFTLDYKACISGYCVRDLEKLMEFLDKVAAEEPELMLLLAGKKELFHNVTDFTSTEKLCNFIGEHAGI